METVMFGSVEFFESELKFRLTQRKKGVLEQNDLAEVHRDLKREILDDFICESSIKLECVQNLAIAMEMLRHQQTNTLEASDEK